MRHPLIYLFTLFIIIGTNNVFAQMAPGYMGKNLSIHGGMFFSPAFSGPNQNGENGFIKFNKANHFAIDFVSGRMTSLELVLQTYNTQVDYNKFYTNNIDSYRGFDNGDDFNISSTNSHTDNYNGLLYVKNYGFNIKQFSEGRIAPYGSFFKYGILYNTFTVESGNLFSEMEKKPMHMDSYNGVFLNFGLGKQRIYWDILMVSYGVNFSLPIYGGYLNHTFSLEDSSYDGENFIEDSSKARLASYHLMNVYFSLGLLLF